MISGTAELLSELLGRPVTLLAYPRGRHAPRPPGGGTGYTHVRVAQGAEDVDDYVPSRDLRRQRSAGPARQGQPALRPAAHERVAGTDGADPAGLPRPSAAAA